MKQVLAFFFIVSILLSCKKNQEIRTTLSAQQQWVLDSMQVYYYWSETLPRNPAAHTSTVAFFKSILNPDDRFSTITDPHQQRNSYSSFAWYGFEYVLLQRKDLSDDLIAMITLVVPNGPAAKKGLKRGDVFTKVNHLLIQSSNVEVIKSLLEEGHGVNLTISKLENSQLHFIGDVLLSYVRFAEQPVYTTRVFEDHGHQTGYLFYNRFNGNYDYNVLDSLKKLKDAAVRNIIIDMRYNPGGDISSVAKIAAVFAPVNAEQVFAIYQANRNGGKQYRSFRDAISENRYQPQDFNELLARRFALPKIYVLTTGATASAAELLINTLKPFMEVVQVGEKTLGKDMASFAIEDQRKPKIIDLTLYPLIFKLYNSKGEGNYSKGLIPGFTVDEFAELPLRPIGDAGDPLIRKALTLIGHTATVKRMMNTTNSGERNVVYYNSSVENSLTATPMSIKER